ncbi:acyltransferase family protein [uncultured Bacteroides sp.]|uniref:acyltransferase family protein n=1 Tax=uncultured Bacteroides sp. TaxID=162156 RepID=UPI002603BF6D|nr:acyltransferase family protein [uncultured Bacteroides sp.]
MEQARIKWLDALKLFAIFLVLWGHAVQHLLSSEYWDEPVYRIIYSFHMPLFMTISGFFGAKLSSIPFTIVLFRKFRQLLLPAISFGLIYCIIVTCAGNLGGGGIWFFIHSFWFLKSLFLCSITYCIASKVPKYTLFAVVLSLIVSQVIPFCAFDRMYPCFIFGVALYKYFDYFQKNIRVMLAVSASIFIVMLVKFDASFLKGFNSDAIKSFDLMEIGRYLYVRYYRILMGFAGSMTFIALFYSLSRWIPNSKLGDTLCKYGKYTLGIYILQTFFLEMILRDNLSCDGLSFCIFNFIVAPLISSCVLIICLVCIKIIHCSPIASWLLLGESFPREK